MKLLYDNIVVGSLSNIVCDMNREGGQFELTPLRKRDSSKLSDQLYKWIEIQCQISEIESTLATYNEENLDLDQFYENLSQLPDFEGHKCWKLFSEETGKMESISFPRFSFGGAGWYLNPSEIKEEEKGYSSVIGVLIGLILLAIYFYIKYQW